ncbi:hypothetical protein SASPL_152005 [Salvia splendens]|uniref:Protein kinase domain-containing protein n=1 Tax=Salvia splendens TaxID=180675 RepID=A0A8X8W2T0_SALSN|nr:hypothetical protein SASPL_152005 [Salvia splendens]
MNVSVGPDTESGVRNAMLNGVEIMELLTDKASYSEDGASSGKQLFVILGSCLGRLVLVLIVFFGVMFLRLRKGNLNWPLGSSYSRTTARASVFADLNLGLKIPLSGILFATNHFDEKLMIGEGGFGKVVAIKRSEAGHGQGLEEFHTEIRVWSKIRHQHLVSLIGYCDEKGEMILVYEFMENGTLREHLYGDVIRSLSDMLRGCEGPNMVDVLWDLEYCRQLQHSAVPRQPYEVTTTEVSWGVAMPVLQRLPMDSFTVEGDDSVSGSFSGVASSQPNGSEVFSLLDMDGGR